MKFNDLCREARIVYLLSLCDLITKDILQSKGYPIVHEALEKCWKWVRDKNIEAHELYLYLENMEEKDVLTYMQFESDPHKEKVWICIGDALAYIIWEAYQYEGEEYLPQTIESVDIETIDDFIRNFKEVYPNSNLAEKLLYQLVMWYPYNMNKEINIISIKKIVDKIIEDIISVPFK